MLELKIRQLNCCKCGTELDAPPDLEPDTYCEERNMGMQIGYTWTYEDECSHCQNPYSFEINAWEYPIGILDSEDFKSEGVELDYEVDVAQEPEDDWGDSWEYVEPSTFDEFNETMLKLRGMLESDLVLTNDIFLKMVDAFAVTAMEAYLSGTLIEKVKNDNTYLLNAAKNIEDLKVEKITLYEVVKNPDQAKNRILENYMNLCTITCLR